MSKGRLLSALGIVAAIAAIFAFGLDQYPSLEYFKARQAVIQAYHAAHPLKLAMLYFTAYVLAAALSLPLGVLMTLAGGAIFGLLWGTVIASFASSVGATLAFLGSRYLFRDALRAKFGDRLRAVNAGIENDGSFYLFAVRLVPVFPYWINNLLFGLTPMGTWTFYWVSQAGMLAGTVLYVNAGTRIAELHSLAGLASPGLIGSLALLGLLPLLGRKVLDVLRSRRLSSKRPPKDAGTMPMQSGVCPSAPGGSGRAGAMIPEKATLRRLSIIVPTLNESEILGRTLDALEPIRRNGHEVIVVDGGSSDGTPGLARGRADRVTNAPRGRASQMNEGAKLARGDVLLFLHADTLLPPEADAVVLSGLAGSTRLWGRFDIRIEGDGPLLSLVGSMMNWRSRVTGIATGDQAFFMLRGTFDQAGGFPQLPLMEDIAMSARLKALSRPLCLKQRVVTSARRWRRRGVLRTILQMWWLRLRFSIGASPTVLERSYYGNADRR